MRITPHRVLGRSTARLDPRPAPTSGSSIRWTAHTGCHWAFPTFGTLIGLLQDDIPVVGVIAFPPCGKWYLPPMVWAAGMATTRQIRFVSELQRLKSWRTPTARHRDHITPRSAPVRSGIQVNLGAYIRGAGRFRFISDCLQHALVCRGRIQAALDVVMHPWDIAALVPCIEEAGGVASYRGEVEGVTFGGSLLTSCGGALHQEILSKLVIGYSIN